MHRVLSPVFSVGNPLALRLELLDVPAKMPWERKTGPNHTGGFRGNGRFFVRGRRVWHGTVLKFVIEESMVKVAVGDERFMD